MGEQLVKEGRIGLYEAEPLVYEIPRIGSDQLVRQRAAELIGSVALQVVAEVPQRAEPQTTVSLMEAIHRVHSGENEPRRLIAINAHTDVIERSMKAGHISEIGLDVNDQGEVTQYGQTAERIQVNSLMFAANSPQMRARIEAETRNMFRIGESLKQNLLDEYVFLAFSRAADDMTEEQAADMGFFTDTMSCAVQATTMKNGKLTTESAFVAGKKHRDDERHDADTIAKLGQLLGVDFTDKTACEVLDTPLLVHKSLMVNGVIDIVRLYDEMAGGTFFGQNKPQQRYDTYPDLCKQREAKFKPMVERIVDELVAQSSSITTPVEATQRLNELSAAALQRWALIDSEIDTTVFGLESAAYLGGARYHYERGETVQMERFLRMARAADRSASCPGVKRKSDTLTEIDQDEPEDTSNSKEDESGDCDFISKQCPMCGAKNVRTMVRKLADGRTRISGSCKCSKTT